MNSVAKLFFDRIFNTRKKLTVDELFTGILQFWMLLKDLKYLDLNSNSLTFSDR